MLAGSDMMFINIGMRWGSTYELSARRRSRCKTTVTATELYNGEKSAEPCNSLLRETGRTHRRVAWNSRLLHDWFQRLQFYSNVSRDSVASLLLCTKVEYNMAGNFVSNKTWERRYKRYVPPEKELLPIVRMFVCSYEDIETKFGDRHRISPS